MSEKRWLSLGMIVAGILISYPVAARATPMQTSALDVLHYSATLEPDIAGKSVKGTVRIRFLTESQQAEFNCGDLVIDSVRLAGATLKFAMSRV